MHLKPNSTAQFTEKEEKEILPILLKQKGFRDQMSFVSPSGTEAFAITLWDRAESAEAYNRVSYPEVAKIIATVIDGTPQVENFNVANSTYSKIAAASA
jgi:hypothetical protein